MKLEATRHFFWMFALFTAPAALGDVSGVVMSLDGEPLAGATVTWSVQESTAQKLERLLSDEPYLEPGGQTKTDRKGGFSLEVPAEQTVVTVTVRRDGHQPWSDLVENGLEIGAIPMRPEQTRSVRLTGPETRSVPVVIWRGSHEEIVSTNPRGELLLPGDPVSIGLRVGDVVWMRDARDETTIEVPAVTLVRGVVLDEKGESRIPDAEVWLGPQRLGNTDAEGGFEVELPSDWDELIVRKGELAAVFQKGSEAVRLREGVRLQGRLISAADDRPVHGAAVDLRASGFRPIGSVTRTVTDASGNFDLGVFPTGRRMVVATAHPGFVSATREVALLPDRPSEVIALIEAGRISGWVVDEEGQGIPAAVVTQQQSPRRMMRRMTMGRVGPAFSDPTGRFVLSGVAPDGAVELIARKKAMPDSEPERVAVESGETTTGARLTIPLGTLLSGTVTDERDVPVGGAKIEWKRSEIGGGRRMVRRVFGERSDEDPLLTDRQGRFSTRVAEGTWDLTVTAEGYAPRTLSEIEVRPGAPAVEVVLSPGHTLRGRVVTANGQGVEGVRVAVMGQQTNDAVTGGDGSFEVYDLPSGPAMVIAMQPERGVQEMRTVKVPSDDLVIELAPTGSIAGVVLDDATEEPVRSFTVTPSSDEVRGGPMMISIARDSTPIETEDGSFQLNDVPSGRTKVEVKAAGFLPATVNGIDVSEGEVTDDVEVRLRRGVRVSGTVTGPDGRPVPGVAVEVGEAGGGRMGMPRMLGGNAVVSDGAGRYVIEAVEPGEQTLTFTHEDFKNTSRTEDLKGETATIDVRLERGLTLTGRVVSASGEPVPGAEVAVVQGSRFDFGGLGREVTDGQGRFRIEGLSEGRYDVRAQKSGSAPGQLEGVELRSDLDVEIVLEAGGVITGSVTGLDAADLDRTVVRAGSVSAAVRPDGSFRLEGLPEGSTTVVATVREMLTSRQSRPETVDVILGGEQSVQLVFAEGFRIAGRVLRGGEPVTAGMVLFRSGGQSVSSAVESGGSYSVELSDPGRYEVSVINLESFGTYTTEYEATGADEWDIVIQGAIVTGRVVSSSGREGVGDARVTIAPAEGDGGFIRPQNVAVSSDGLFRFEDVAPGSWLLTARSETEGTASRAIVVTEGRDEQVEIILSGSESVLVQVVDGTGRPIPARIELRDAAGSRVFFGQPTIREDGTMKLEAGAGTYRISVRADGYGRVEDSVSIPGPTKRIVLQSGGTLRVVLGRSEPVQLQLLDRLGQPVSLAWSRQVTISATTDIEDLSPGRYTLRVTGEDGVVTDHPVEVRRGEVSVTNI